tara:strand:+ start:396 stop:575 length:180 start_codon:yes stop_codon:yes gene_type:complete
MVYYIIFFVILVGYFSYIIGKGNAKDTEIRLKKIKDLHKRNIINDEEYESMRRKIILDI